MDDRKGPKVYDFETAMKMLPLLRSFARSLVEYSKWVADMFSEIEGKDEIQELHDRSKERRDELRIEFAQMSCKICHSRLGLVDVPVIHPHDGEVVYVCVDPETFVEEDIKAHKPYDDFKGRKGFWEL